MFHKRSPLLPVAVPIRQPMLSFQQKEFHKVEFPRRARLPNGNIFHSRECASRPEGFLYDREVRRTFLSYKKSLKQITLLEADILPWCHSNWLINSAHSTIYYHICHLVTAMEAVIPYSDSGMPSKVHSAKAPIPQSHHLRLSVMFCCCLLLFLIGFAYVAIYHTIGFCCCQVIIFRNFSSLSQCHRNPMLYRLGQFLNHSPWQQGSVAAFFRQQEAVACHWIKTTVYL